MMEADGLTLNDWADTQAQISAVKMAESVSPTTLIKYRSAFGHSIRPAAGSVIAAIGSADNETEPDYFFHWLRDSAAVMDSALVLIGEGIAPDLWRQHFADFVRFSLDLSHISGKRFVAESGGYDARAERTPQQYRQFLRTDAELSEIEGYDKVLGDVRYNADCSIDFLTWSRPQHDGTAARALTCLRFLAAGAVNDDVLGPIAELIRIDLDYTLKFAGASSVDIWEEESAHHYYTVLVQCEALHQGARWAEARGEGDYAAELSRAARRLEDELERFWSAERGYLLSRIMPPGATTT